MLTDKLTPYKTGSYPQLPGGDAKFLTGELRKVHNAVSSTQAILKSLEVSGTVASKAGAVSASDLIDGRWQVIHDTTGNTIGLYANLGGTLFKVMLA